MRIAGKPLPPSPNGTFTLPDVQISEAGPTSVEIEAHQIPVGTRVELHLFSEDGSVQVLTSEPLTGQLASSSTTMMVTFPVGFTRGFPRASWP
jgi:hypothetical protein